MAHYSRKRPRSCEDDSCELMPISKRINDLHIRSGYPETDSSVPDSASGIQPQNQSSKSSSNVCMTDLTKEPYEKEENMQLSYEPELTVTENPYYYRINGVLFDAHIQRLQRLSKFLT